MMKIVMLMIMMMIIKNKKFSFAMLMMIMNSMLQTKINSKLSYGLTGDLISFWITDMSMMIIYILMFMKIKNMKFYYKVMITFNMIIFLTFYNWNFMMFYIMFEVSMIMVLVIIISWGYQPERIEAMLLMVVMTMIFSLPVLMAMVNSYKTLSFWFLKLNMNTLTFISFLFVFMMKMPVYFMHFWLPKVHVEAPVSGSMILAAIMLKLGCYGLMRMNKLMIKFYKMNFMVLSLSTWSMIILSAMCMVQTDTKTLIAYSSIVHMTMVFMTIITLKYNSLFGSMLVIVGHGMCSSAMFFYSNLLYKMTKSRSMILNKGISLMSQPMTLMWFVTCMNNAPMPPSINMLGEMIMFKSITNWSSFMYPLLAVSAFASSMYSIYLFYMSTHGNLSSTVNMMMTQKSASTMIMMVHVTPLILMISKPEMMKM